MKRLAIILFGTILWGFLSVPGNAVAHPSHHAGAHSPFDAPKVKKSLHCELLNHHHTALPFCPHTQHGRSAETQLKTDCPDSPSGVPIQIQWSKTLMLYPSFSKTASTINKHIVAVTRLQLFSPFKDLPDRPPQHA